ncbi:hypothetical protein DFR70_101333 [Nocardia tenerifensis]|uniref:Uncharacterized protein n=1 Tax=Nocardia tenerifensis TaxID=228006 RepID=A0A318KFA3_9NOCA|nr:hypothetical protein [Nocardia tenerifensis]PXX70912.1 hypothetical protein DFR70_101333 [Nocardia tenerifensis]
MSDESEREQALRQLPLPYSLALRLRDGGVDPALICEYIGVELAALEGVYRMAEAKLAALHDSPTGTTAAGPDTGAAEG